MAYTITQADYDNVVNNNVQFVGRDGDGYEWGVGSNIYGGKFELAANDGYVIDSVSYRDNNGWSVDFDVSDDGKLATLDSFDDENPPRYYEIYTTQAVASPDYLITQAIIDSLVNDEIVLKVNDVDVVDGTEVFNGDLLLLVVNDGYEIESISGRDDNGFEINWLIADDFLSATRTSTGDFSEIDYITIETRFIQSDDVKGYNDIYRVTDDQMREVATASFEFFNGQTTVDYGEYIIGAIDFPFEIRADQITGFQNIGLGASVTDINAELLTTDTIKINMGSIFVPPIENNLLDFANTVAILHLPYADSIAIDIDYVIGETVSIEYIVSLYDGHAIVNVSSSKIDGVINTRNVDLNISIPFGNIDSNPSNNDPKNVELGGDNGIKTPHIEILRNDAVLPYGFFTTPIADESLLMDQIGFVKVDEIDLKVTASKDEKEMILSVVNQGVIIK